MEEGAWSGKCRTFKVSGSFDSRQQKKTWNEVIRSDLEERDVNKETAKDRNAWKAFEKNRPTTQAWKVDFKKYMMVRMMLRKADKIIMC